MKRYVLLYMASCLFLGAGWLCAAQKARIVHFTIFLKDDSVVTLDRRRKRLDIQRSAFDIIIYEKEGDTFRQVGRMDWPKITRNIYSIDLTNSYRMVYTKSKLLLRKHDGTQKLINNGSLHHADGEPVKNLLYTEYNRIAGRWTEASIPIENIKKIVLGTTQLMINTKSGALYPPDYRYDPYTGSALVESALEED
jgi:hypothetical protein